MDKTTVTINGKKISLKNSCNVALMIKERNITGTMFVVEKNKQIVQKEFYESTPVVENDVFEIVGFFGGG